MKDNDCFSEDLDQEALEALSEIIMKTDSA